jgi:hypothetical protein
MQKSAKILITLLVILGISIPGVYFGIKMFAQKQIDQVSIVLNQVNIKELDRDRMVMSVDFTLDIPANLDASFELWNLIAKYNGAPVGSVELLENSLQTSQLTYTKDLILTVTNQTGYQMLVSDYVNEVELLILLEGNIHFTGNLAGVPDQTLSKTLTLPGLNGLNFTVSDFRLVDMNGDNVELEIGAIFKNPTTVQAKLAGIGVNIDYKGDEVGSASITNYTLVSGDNSVTFTANINASGTTLVNDFISNASIEFHITGFIPLSLNNKISFFTRNLSVDGLDKLPLTINRFMLVNFTQTEMQLEIDTTFNNTSALSANFNMIRVNIQYNGVDVGVITETNISFVPGPNHKIFLAVLNASGNIIDDFINGENLTIILNGWVLVRNQSSGEDYVQIFVRQLNVPGLKGIPIFIDKISLISMAETELVVDVYASFYNPSQIEAEISQLTLNIIYDGSIIGTAVKNDFNLSIGAQEIVFRVTLDGDGNDLLSDFVLHEMLVLFVNGSFTFTQQSGSPTPNSFNKTFSIKGLNGLPFKVNQVNLIDSTGTSLTTQIIVQFTNPSAFTADFKVLTLDLYYSDRLIGVATKSDVNFTTGANLLVLNFVLDQNSTTLITDFINDASIGIEIFGRVQIGADPAKAMQVLAINWTMVGLDDLTPVINNLSITNADADFLYLDLNVQISNSVDYVLNISTLWLDIIYKGTYLGNASKTNLVMNSGSTNLVIQAKLGGNKTAISQMLTDYINGYMLNFTINLTIAGLNLDESLAVQLPGVTGTLVSLTVTAITVTPNLYPTPSVTYNIQTRITINNPMNFAIMVTSFTGNLDFDDNDPSSFGMMNYPAQDNISLGSATLNNISLPASGNNFGSYTYSGSDLEKGIRLNDEYNNDHDLAIDVTNGVLSLAIGGFNVNVNIALENIPVS